MANTQKCLTMILVQHSKSLLIALAVLVLAAPASQASECQCGCREYFLMLETIDADTAKMPAKLDRCAGACANSWYQCEIRHDKSEQPAAVKPEDSESDSNKDKPGDHDSHDCSH